MMPVNWKKNLLIAWLGSFLTGASFSLVMPFMALYVEELGVPSNQVALYAGWAVAIAAIGQGLFSPIWGRLADRYGRKLMMIRAALVMTFTMGGLAFVPNVFWLLLLRLLNGIFSGYVPNANALIASQAPKSESGQALGSLATGVIGGSLIGPLFGGALAEWMGIRNVFLFVGALLFLVTLLTIFFVEEEVEPVTKEEQLPTLKVFQSVKDGQILIGLFITSMIIQISAQSVSPILPLYIRYLGYTKNLMVMSGLIVSAMSFSGMLSSSLFGRISDRVGNHRFILGSLIYSCIIYLFMAFSTHVLQLAVLRFLFGFGTGALMPSVNALLTKITPRQHISTIFSYNQMMTNFGQVIGPFVGSTVASMMGYRWVFYITSVIVLVNFFLCLINFKKYLRSREI